MKDLFLVNYSVKGIKTLDELVSLSFYKKTITNALDTQEYNMKAIYGMNGSGKTGIITSVDILRNILTNTGYLNNPYVQEKLEANINKKKNELFIETDFIVKLENELCFFRYHLTLAKTAMGKYEISGEELLTKKATSKKSNMDVVFKIVNGEIVELIDRRQDGLVDKLKNKTLNLLSTASMSALFFEKMVGYILENQKEIEDPFASIAFLYILGQNMYVFLEESDEHKEFYIQNSLKRFEYKNLQRDSLLKKFGEATKDNLNILSAAGNIVPKRLFKRYENTVVQLKEFLKIFKSDLQDVEIDKKESQEYYICNLVMVYDSYKIHAEVESTGIKKLIKLFAFLNEMIQGGIVFIDEFDSNLHDVYLCALLEYLMEYGQGQLCFTTHNVGPMDILKNRKKSIDFLSIDHKIYPWTKNGNYSPGNLYRSGMIEGSPFNIDSTDFIGVFYAEEEDD